jgi:hypothetical protein
VAELYAPGAVWAGAGLISGMHSINLAVILIDTPASYSTLAGVFS